MNHSSALRRAPAIVALGLALLWQPSAGVSPAPGLLLLLVAADAALRREALAFGRAWWPLALAATAAALGGWIGAGWSLALAVAAIFFWLGHRAGRDHREGERCLSLTATGLILLAGLSLPLLTSGGGADILPALILALLLHTVLFLHEIRDAPDLRFRLRNLTEGILSRAWVPLLGAALALAALLAAGRVEALMAALAGFAALALIRRERAGPVWTSGLTANIRAGLTIAVWVGLVLNPFPLSLAWAWILGVIALALVLRNLVRALPTCRRRAVVRAALAAAAGLLAWSLATASLPAPGTVALFAFVIGLGHGRAAQGTAPKAPAPVAFHATQNARA